MSVEMPLKMFQRDFVYRDYNVKTEFGHRKHPVYWTGVTVKVVSLVLSLTLTVVVLAAVLGSRKKEHISEFPVCASCPEHWIGFRGKCYYFSEDVRNWTFSQTFCSLVEASLAQFETLEELNFMKRYKGPSDHWIGLRRKSSNDIWKWMDGTDHNKSFVIRGAGECAYLNDKGVSSARSYTDRKWICNKLQCQNDSSCK